MAAADLRSATEVRPVEAPVTELKGLPKAGVELARWVLVIMAATVLLLLLYTGVSEFAYAQWLHAQRLPLDQGAEAIIKEQAAAREFWLKVFQMPLLNALLPVLTAILGYTFGKG